MAIFSFPPAIDLPQSHCIRSRGLPMALLADLLTKLHFLCTGVTAVLRFLRPLLAPSREGLTRLNQCTLPRYKCTSCSQIVFHLSRASGRFQIRNSNRDFNLLRVSRLRLLQNGSAAGPGCYTAKKRSTASFALWNFKNETTRQSSRTIRPKSLPEIRRTY